MNDMEKAVEKFNRALQILNIKHNKETGRLSEPMIMIAYDANRKITIERVFIFKKFFLVIKDQENDVKKIFHDKVQSFRSTVKMID